MTVRLLDAAGVSQVATTTTDALGNYLFEDIAGGIYLAEIVPPAGQRLAINNFFDLVTNRIRIGLYDDVVGLDVALLVNAAPTAGGDALLVHRNTPATGNVRLNDADAEGDALTVALAAGPQHGTVTLNPDGTFTYTPDTNYTGTDAFTYTLDDGYGGTATGTVSITVASTAAPTGTGDSYSEPYAIYVDATDGVLANDTAPNGPLTAVLASGPAHGTLELYPDGSFLYTPLAGFVGADTFTYFPTDADGPGALTLVSLTVTDAAPVAADDTATTNEDTAVTLSVLGNDTDPDSDALAVLAASDGLFGTTVVNADGTITYTPYANWNGTDQFSYLIDDGYGRLSLATATVTVTPVNDAPGVGGPLVVAQRNTPIDVDLRTRVSDIETPLANVSFSVGYAYRGTVALLSNGYTARFTPDADYYGGAFFGVEATDAGDGSAAPISASGSVNLSVNAPPEVSGGLWAHLAPGQTATFYLSISDFDGDAWALDSYTQPAYGSVSPDIVGATFNYTAPTTPFVGTTTFTVTASDGRGGVTVKTITVELMNQSPQGSNASLSTAVDMLLAA